MNSETIPEGEKKRLEKVGYDTSGKLSRSASFLMSDNRTLLSEKKEKKLEILSTELAVEKYPWVKDLMFKLVRKDKDDYTRLAASSPPRGFFLRVLPGAKINIPVQSCFFIKTKRLSQVVHNIIVAEPESEVHIITGCTTASYVKQGSHIGITEFYVRENATLTYTMLHDWAPEVVVYPRSSALVEKNGVFISNYIALTRVKEINSYPEAHVKDGGIARFYSIIYAQDESFFDIGAATFLEEKGARGEIINRVVSSGGRVVSRGHILGAAKDTKGHMECSGLLLNKKGMIHAIPELKGIFPETELSHEAAVGKIADEEINYLMTRGIDKDTAVSLIVRGFLDTKIKGLPPQLQKLIAGIIEKSSLGGRI